jgi:1,4-dihydroxy-6-naphthoate synthase
MSGKIRLGISTCPNDTFAFHGLLTRAVDWRGEDFEVELLDVQELNERLGNGQLDIAKVSFHAALRLGNAFTVLPTGSAIGFGVGPLLLSRLADAAPDRWPGSRPPIVLCPGELTTATLLYRLFYPPTGDVRQVIFSAIMPALQAGTADFGVCIHEGRFTWRESGLDCVADLGTVWEERTGQPLPLGGLVGATALGDERLQRIAQVIADSIDYGFAHPDEALVTMRGYAQELADEVIMAHVDLYVSAQTRAMGADGRAALQTMWEIARDAGALPEDMPPPRIL